MRMRTAFSLLLSLSVLPLPALAADITTSGSIEIYSAGPTGTFAVPDNLALSSNGATAFALDELSGFGHLTVEANDGIYGNTNSWIGDGGTGTSGPYIGISLPASTSINSIAFGRSNDPSGDPCAGGCTDRALGTYTLQYRNDGSTADDLGWTTIGTISYTGGSGPPMTLAAARHQYTFDSVDATAFRLIVPATGLAAGTAIDEIELYSNVAAPIGMTLIGTGPAGPTAPDNLALASNGATAFAKDLIGNGAYAPTHTIGNLNDGIYGNSNSWIGESEATFAGVDLGGSHLIDQIAFGRDSGGEATQFIDRTTGLYTIQYTNVPNPDENTPLEDWITIDVLEYDGLFPDATPFLRHLFEFDPIEATGVRILVSDGGLTGGIAIDEIEVFAAQVPEPGSVAIWIVAGLMACCWVFRRRH